jgi:peptide deformylase
VSFRFDPKRQDKLLTNRVQKLLNAHPDNLLPITKCGEEVLRKQCPVYKGGIPPELLRKLITAMKVTMHKAPGVGLAGPQIGLNMAIAVIEDSSVEEDYNPFEEEDARETYHLPFFTIINPSYTAIGSETRDFYEGCLSFTDFYAVRKRHHKILAKWTDEKGKDHEQELQGWPARIFQHETDHLSGEIYIDKAILRSLTTSDNLYEFGLDENIEDTAHRFGFKL